MFSGQDAFCNTCGRRLDTDFKAFDGRFCGRECHKEMEWRKTLSILGKRYEPQPTPEGGE